MGDKFLSRIIFVFALLLPGTVFFMGSCSKKESEVYPLPGPLITSFVPSSGAKDSTVVITGTDFSISARENIVTFNGVNASIVAATATSLTVKVPPGAHDGKIMVSTGDQATRSAEDFNYIFTASTFAGSGGYGFANGAGNIAQFKDAYGVATDASGNIYVADGSNNRVRKISPAGVVGTLAGTGDIGYVNGDAGVAQFNYPHGVAVDASGNVYVADAGNNRVRKITPAGVVSTLAGSGDPAFADGTGTAAAFNFPADLVVDASGNVFVSDGGNHRIRKITPAGVVSTLPGSGTTGFAEFSFPEGIAMDAAGNLYIADAGGQRINKISSAGIVSVLAGSGVPGYADKPGIAAQFNDPEGIAVDALGNVYVGDLSNHAVRKITPAGIVSTLGGNGHPGFADEIAAPGARFSQPSGIAVDAQGNIYVADVGNSRIRKLL